MEPILVDRTKLLGIVVGNRAKHVIAYEVAKRGYRITVSERVRAAAKRALKAARMGREVVINFHFPLPQNHVKQYDRVIGMLRMDTSKQIKLDAADYERYVRDKWEWSDAFTTSNATYGKGLTALRKRR